MTHDFHRFWLKVTAIVIGSFAPVFFLGTMASTAEPARLTLDLLSWPIDGSPAIDAPGTRFLSALTGGFLLGWAVTIWFLSTTVYDAAPEAVRRAVVAGLTSWFVLDCAGSITSGNAVNVPFNVIVLLVGVGPLWRPARPDAKR